MPSIRTCDARLHYRETGTGEPLLLLHGLGASCDDWDLLAPELSAEFRLIMPCLRGFGHSSQPRSGYSIARFAQDAAALIRALGLESCHVFGHSLGGAVAFQLAADAPQLVRSLAVLNSLPSYVIDSWAKRMLYLERMVLVHVFGLRIMARRGAARAFPQADQAHLRARTLARQDRNRRRIYIAVLRALKGWSVTDRLAGSDVPTLMLSADQDLTTVEEKARHIAGMPAARLVVIPDSRHATHVDQPVALAQQLRGFLRGDGAGRIVPAV